MTVAYIPAGNLFPPQWDTDIPMPTLTSPTAISASNHQIAMIGVFMHKAGLGASKTVTNVGLNWGAITPGGTPATCRVSLQGVSATTGNPQRPDGSILNSGNAFWTRTTDTISPNSWDDGAGFTGFSLTVGTMIAVVIDFSAFTSGDSVTIRGLQRASTATAFQRNVSGQMNRTADGSTWAAQPVMPNSAIGCDDGTFGFIDWCPPVAAVGSVAFASDTGTADEYGIGIYAPYPQASYGAHGPMLMNTDSSDFELIVYSDPEGTPAIVGSANTIDGAWRVAAFGRISRIPLSAITALSKDTQYCLAVRPTGTGTATVTLYYIDVDDANHLRDCYAGINCCMMQRLNNSGAFSRSNSGLRFPILSLVTNGYDDAAGGGGGGGMPPFSRSAF